MGLITDMEPGKRDPKRVNIYLDGKFAFAISQEAKYLNKLQINEEITAEKINQLIFSDQIERLYEKAVRFLSFRPRSEREIKNFLLRKLKLTDKGEDEKANFEKSTEEVTKKLKQFNLINDLEFAIWWVEQRVKFKKISQRIIKSELFKKGIDKEIIEEVLTREKVDEFSTALELGKKKIISYGKFEEKEKQIRLSRFLASKGFDWGTTKRVVDTLLQKD